MHSKKCLSTAAAIVTVVAAAVLLIGYLNGGYCLTLRGDWGQIYGAYPLNEGDRFAVTFIHSVNQYPLTDVYEIHDGIIYVEECKYEAFGAGVQTDLNPGESLTYTDDGAMLITGIHQARTDLRYTVGTVSDHTLSVNGQEISLRELCGKNAHVKFSYQFVLFKKH